MRVRHQTMIAAAILAAACDAGTGTGTRGVSGFGGSGAATQLAFTVQPSNAIAGAAITPAVRVAAVSSAGSTDPSFANSVTVTIGANPGGGTLSGTTTVSAVAGVATFSNLSISSAGAGYTLIASTATRTPVTSAAFSITTATPVAPH